MISISMERVKQPPQPLDGHVFVISGNPAEKGEKKLNTGQLTELILSYGGSVYTGDIEKAVNADYVLIMLSQKEVDKEHSKLNKASRFGGLLCPRG